MVPLKSVFKRTGNVNRTSAFHCCEKQQPKGRLSAVVFSLSVTKLKAAEKRKILILNVNRLVNKRFLRGRGVVNCKA